MNYSNLHPWKVSLQQAIQIQANLRKRIILNTKLPKIHRIAGVDVAFSSNEAFCAVCVFESCTFPWSEALWEYRKVRDEYPKLNLIEVTKSKRKITFPYVPGFLTFREGPVILDAFRRLKTKPDIVLFDGQGICHSRRMGIATHLGIILDIPSIGCAKSPLYGVYEMPGENKGDFSFIYRSRNSTSDNDHAKNKNDVLGVVLRTRWQVKPIFISCGYKISLMPAVRLVLKLTPKYRIPQPLRYAHQLAEHARLSV